MDAVVATVLPQRFVAVSEYMPADAVLTIIEAGLRSVEVKPPGPLHAYEVEPVAEPLNVNVWPTHSAVADEVATTELGSGVIVILTGLDSAVIPVGMQPTLHLK